MAGSQKFPRSTSKQTPYVVFKQATGYRNLRRIYEIHVRPGRARGRDGGTPDSLRPSIVATVRLVSDRLREGTFRYTQYRQLTVSRGPGKHPRVLSIPTARDRIALRALAEFLGKVFPYALGVLSSRRVAQAIEALTDNVTLGRPFDSFVRLDVRDFYPSIRHSDIEQELRKRIRKREALDAIMRAVQTPTVADRYPAEPRNTVGVPQGLAISNILAELIANPIDRKFRDDPRCSYFRYVDDILILCASSDTSKLAAEVTSEFGLRNLTVHPLRAGGKSEQGKLSKGFDYLGYKFKDSGRAQKPIQVSVRKSSIMAIEGRLSRIFSEYRKRRDHEPEVAQLVCELKLNLAITGCIFESVPRGWLPYYRQLNDFTLLKHLDSLVDFLGRKYELPADVHPKKFLRAYWALRYPHGRDARYIRSFDDLQLDEQRRILTVVLSPEDTKSLTDAQVPDAFKKAIGALVSEFERDIKNRS